jgi:DNA repair protein RadA/Sms
MPYECTECGYSNSKWLGRCSQCNEWDSFVEVPDSNDAALQRHSYMDAGVEELSSLQSARLARLTSGYPGLDRLLGGGIVPGEVILLGGPPGVGKSTLFLQLADRLSSAGNSVLFVSGEVNPSQLKLHAERLGVAGQGITVMGSGNIEQINSVIEKESPGIVFVDSIQSVADPAHSSAPGTIKQVKLSGQKLTAAAKNHEIVVVISAQVTKHGDIAGPKLVEHMVDAVMHMDYVQSDARIVSISKNRFGSCGDFIIYSLDQKGLHEVDSAQENILGAEKAHTGQVSGCVKSGERFVAAEIQALTSQSYFEYPLRRTSGFPRERLLMLSAIAAKHLQLKLSSCDLYLNVSGGNKITERENDLGVVASIYSSMESKTVSNRILFVGEVGLNGEVRPHRDTGLRLKFAARCGFTGAVISSYGSPPECEGLKIKCIGSISQLKDVFK